MPVLAIQSEENTAQAKCTPNVLPCRVNHNGPVHASERYWAPSSNDNSTKIVYFRGRKLQGKTIKVPEGYRGVVMSSTDSLLVQQGQRKPSSNSTGIGEAAFEADSEDGNDDEMTEETKVLKEHASFNEIVVWDHDTLLDAASDTYLRGMDEWVVFAEQINSFPTPARASDA